MILSRHIHNAEAVTLSSHLGWTRAGTGEIKSRPKRGDGRAARYDGQ